MTVDTNKDVALFTMSKQEVEVAESKPRGRKRPSAEVVTPDGDNAQQIIAAWITMLSENTDGLPIPSNVIKRLAKQVKSLISSRYETNQIKYGLSIWTVRWMDNPLLSPEALDRLTWKFVMDSSPEGRRFQEEMRTAVHRLAGHSTAVSSGTSRKDQRTIENTQGKQNWRERHAERKRREEGL